MKRLFSRHLGIDTNWIHHPSLLMKRLFSLHPDIDASRLPHASLRTKRLFSLFFALCILSTLNARPCDSHSPKADSRILVASHRGDWQVAPENSIAAFTAAILAGVTIIETDVRLTKDKQCVLLHDTMLDRTTNGRGALADTTLEEVRSLRLRDALGTLTQEHVPTLKEALLLAKAHNVYLYLDKAGTNNGEAIPHILALAKELDALQHLLFVLNWPYEKAHAVFKDDLTRVQFCPVISDNIPELTHYVDTWLTKAAPFAFQFRFNSLETLSFKILLPKVLSTSSRAFIAATWATHTAGHDDALSLTTTPEAGWGWLIQHGFTILETNHPRALLHYLRTK